jgi:predicted DsbA family dithiol-disulfide isomerase
MTLSVDIVSDVVCPWCLIGKRNFERALALYRERHPDAEAPAVRWHPFQLNPQMPATGMPRAEYTASKFGGHERAREVYARVAAAGANAGIEFDFDRITVQPNTVDAHRLIHRAAAQSRQDDMVESLFRGYFLETRDLTKLPELVDLAARAGIDAEEARRYLESSEDRDLILQQDQQARQIGVEGVPFFIFNQKYAVSGAQPPELLLEAMERAATEGAGIAAAQ